jgi:8-oxo-dGTP pyrophosphatase MutT (NUDIX family)
MSTLHEPASAAVAIIRSLAPLESILILRRNHHPGDPWSGHYSFPGGRKDLKDPDLLATCIRETREETGLLLDADNLQQRLPHEPAGRIFHSRLWVAPFLFTISNPPSLILCQKEIQGAYWLNVKQFKNIELHKNVELLPGQIFPAYPLDDYYLWGFTYRLLKTILFSDNKQK